jgi:hypothetical protein
MLFSFANWVVRLSKPRRPHTKARFRNVRRFPVYLELLEDRTVLDTVHWVNPNGGDWGVAANWDLRVPLSGDDVVIPANFNNININHTTGTDTVASLDSEQNLNVITAGSLTVTGAFTQGSNRTLTVSTVFTANGATNINNANLSAVSAGHINLPGATGFDGTGNRNLRLEANGAGTLLDLSNVTQFTGAGGPGNGSQIQVWAENGGSIDMRHVATVNQGNTFFFAGGTGGQLNLSALTSFTGARNDSSQLEADRGGTILAPGLTAVNNISLVQVGDATFPTTMLSSFLNSNAQVFSFNGSGTLRLPAVTNFDGTGNRSLRLEANGAGTLLDLSNVTQFTGAGGPGNGSQIQVWAQNGGSIDLRHVATVNQGNTYFFAGGTAGQVNLSALTSFTGARNDSSLLEADRGGTILAPGLTTVNTISLAQVGDATLPTTMLSNFVNSNAQVLSVNGSGTLRLLAVTNFDGTGNRSLRLEANGAGSLLDLSNVTQFTGAGGPGNGSQIQVWAQNGGSIDMRHVATVNQGNTYFFAGGTGGQLNLSALTSFTGARNDSSQLEADRGGTLLAPGLTTVNTISLVQVGDATLPTTMLSNFLNSNAQVISANGSGTLRLSALTNFDGTGNRSLRLDANGAGSLLDLSNVTQFTGAGGPGNGSQIQVWAENGGSIDMRHVANVNQGNTFFFAGGTGGQLNLSALTSFTGARNDSSQLEADRGGTVLAPGLTTVNTISLVQVGDATLPTTMLSSFLNSNAQVSSANGSGTLRLLAMTNFDGTGNRSRRLDANGAGSLLDLSNVTQFMGAGGPGNGSQIQVFAENGGSIDLRHVATVNQGNTYFFAGGTGGQLNLSAMTSFTGARSDSSILGISTGGMVTLSNGTTILNTVTVQMNAPSTITVGTLQLATGSSLSTAGTIMGSLDNGTQVQMNNLPDILTVTGNYTQSGTLSGAGNLNVGGLTTWTAGTMSGTGQTNANGGLTLSGSVGKTLDGRTLNDGGSGTWTGSNLDMGHGAALNLLATATLDAMDDHDITNTLGGAATVGNAGTLKKSNGAGTTNIGVSFSNTATATLQVQTGTLRLTGTFSNFNSGTSTLTDGNYLVSGSLRFAGANIVTNRANIVLDGAASEIADLGGADALTGFNANQGTFTIQNGRSFMTAGAFNNTGTVNVGSNSTLTVMGTYTQASTLSVLSGGTLNLRGGGTAAGTVSNAGTISLLAGTTSTITGSYSQTGRLTVPATATFNVMGTFTNFVQGTLTGGTYELGGTLQFTGANITTNAATVILDGSSSQIVDQSGSNALANLAANNVSLTVQNGRSLSTGADFANTATLIVGDGSSFATSGAFSNSGSVTIGNGSNLNSGGDYLQTDGSTVLGSGTLSAGGTVNLQGGILSGSGTLSGTVVNAAEIDIGTSTDVGLISVTGDYSQTGNLVMKISGADPSLYDQLAIGGNATFAGGTLTIVLIGGYMPDPTVPDTFQIISFGTHDPSDDFGTYVGTDLGGGVMLVPQYSDTNLTLVTTQTSSPQPMTGKTPPIGLSADPSDLRPNGVPVALEASVPEPMRPNVLSHQDNLFRALFAEESSAQPLDFAWLSASIMENDKS